MSHPADNRSVDDHTNAIRDALEAVRDGRLPRRRFVQQMLGLGLSVPMAGTLLLNAGIAQAEPPPYKPTKRGGGGNLKLLMWQGPTLLNPHFATGVKDEEGSRIFYEPLAWWDAEANLVPVLAAEIPSRANGGISADGKSVVWKLKKGVTWHDGQPFTADDVVFNYVYADDPATAAVTGGHFDSLKIEKIDSHTVRVVFTKPQPFWAGGYSTLPLIPKHLFAAYSGAKSREAPANLKPVGTGPYKFVEFRPGDLIRAALYEGYHQPTRPHFDTVELKGGGDAPSAARAVLQTGEYDYAYNLQVEDDILKRLENGGKGRVVFSPGGNIEGLHLNFCDPNTEVEGERAHTKTRHPLWSDPAVRQAMGLLIDRKGMQDFIYGRGGIATPNWINAPVQFRSNSLKYEFNIDKANAVLEAAGWKRGPDGIREKGGKKLKGVFQTSINAPRQKVQQMIKQAAQKAGIELELKQVVASVFFSSDVGNNDTYGKFYADVQMYQVSQGRPDPQRHLQRFVSWEISAKANKWLGINLTRWRSEEYDKTFKAAEFELDTAKRAALLIKLNDLVCSDGYVHPLLFRPKVTGLARNLVAPMTGWDNDLIALRDWYREG